MVGRIARLGVLLASALLLLAGCGGSGEEGATTTTPTEVSPAPAAPPPQTGSSGSSNRGGTTPRPQANANHERGGDGQPLTTRGRDAQVGPAQFETHGGDNSIQRFGSEAQANDFDQAAATLHRYLDFRAAGDWSGACSELSRGVKAQLSRLFRSAPGARDHPPNCAAFLRSSSPAGAGEPESAQAAVAAFRAEGNHGFLLYHGAGDIAYFFPMMREGGTWKLAAIAGSSLQ